MNSFDYDVCFENYVKSFMSEMDFVEELSLLDPYANSQEYHMLKHMIDLCKAEREDINRLIEYNGLDPIPRMNYCNIVGNC